MAAATLPVTPQILGPAPHPLRFAERFVAARGGRSAGHRLGRKALATFPTPALENRLTLARPHAGTETVLLGAATVVWLKRTFHGT